MTSPRTLFDKIWQAHIVRDLGGGWVLLHLDRRFLHDLSGPDALAELGLRGLPVLHPELVFAIPDHAVPSHAQPEAADPAPLRNAAAAAGIRFIAAGEVQHGIVHVVAPERGLVLPGMTAVCGDSHTCTMGGIGALAFGIGSSDAAHALATQTLRLRTPKRMRIGINGMLGRGVTAKDLALHLIATLGAAAGAGHAIEYAGATVRALPVEARLTLCNLSAELGARIGLIAPDDTVFQYCATRPAAPDGETFETAVAAWRSLASDPSAAFEREIAIEAASIAPTITWGTSPEQAIAIDAPVPDPADIADQQRRLSARQALAYMGLEPGAPIAGTAVDWVFIGSCTNARLPDLRAAAAILRDRRIAERVTGWVVPGSQQVKRAAEAEGLDRIFIASGFEWREPGCSLCVAANGDRVPPGARCVSTSNRNFVGRQGPGARTHLASPAMAAAAAIAGALVDVRRL